MSKIKLSEFDLYGTFRLTKDETAGIEDLVQKLGENEYLSRNVAYYPKGNYNQVGHTFFRDLCREYARLNELLPMSGKPAFVVCEKMHELATRVINRIQQKYQMHLFQNGENFDTVAQKCAQECADNLVRLIHDQPAIKTTTKLSDERRLWEFSRLGCKYIEADNKKQLYLCANALPDAEHLITPGGGSSKLGTFVQAVRRHKGLKPLGFTQINYSRGQNNREQFAEHLPHLPEKLLVMDDLICHGGTLINIKQALTQKGHQVTNGAMTARYYPGRHSGAFFAKQNWAREIDIVPNQYAHCNEQINLLDPLDYVRRQPLGDVAAMNYLKDFLGNFDDNCLDDNCFNKHTAAYYSMKKAESRAHDLGADLYQVSAKISPAAVDYNQKIRAQIEKYDAELQESLNL